MRTIFILICFCSLLSCGNNENTTDVDLYSDGDSQEQRLQKGKVLFSTNCRICHAQDKHEATGMAPVLENINENWPDKSILAKYIANAPAMMSETAHTRELYQEWKGKAQMPAFAGLSKDDIDCIIAYISQ
jgi:mono/diheme cytochrome c family protein